MSTRLPWPGEAPLSADRLEEYLPPPLRARFAPTRELGRGGMGRVLACLDRELGRSVAVKVMTPGGDPSRLARFSAEAAALAGLKHPHLVQVFDHGVADGLAWIVMELLDGPTLEAARPADPLPAMLEVAEALDAVHARGICHRDLKPANVVLTRDRGAVLVDFGLMAGPGGGGLTATGAVVGTVGFMAPEVLAGRPAGPAADWYAFGATLSTLLEGRPPEPPGGKASSPGQAPAGTRPDPRTGPGRVVAACMADDPAHRPVGRPGIEALLRGPAPAPGGRPWPVWALAALLGGVAAAFVPRAPAPAPAGAPPLAPVAVPDPTGGLIALGPNRQGFHEFRRREDGLVMVLVPGRRFVSRATTEPAGPGVGREVVLGAFLMDKFEVTREAYSKYLAAVPTAPRPAQWGKDWDYDPQVPVVLVEHGEARAYAAWAGGRLPDTLEYELAATGGDGRAYPWGDEPPTPRRAVTGRMTAEAVIMARAQVKPVGSTPEGASPYGILDLVGNASEWCEPVDPAVSGLPPAPPGHMPIRGGSWFMEGPLLEPRYHRLWPGTEAEFTVGFRVARDWRGPLPAAHPPGGAQ